MFVKTFVAIKELLTLFDGIFQEICLFSATEAGFCLWGALGTYVPTFRGDISHFSDVGSSWEGFF